MVVLLSWAAGLQHKCSLYTPSSKEKGEKEKKKKKATQKHRGKKNKFSTSNQQAMFGNITGSWTSNAWSSCLGGQTFSR